MSSLSPRFSFPLQFTQLPNPTPTPIILLPHTEAFGCIALLINVNLLTFTFAYPLTAGGCWVATDVFTTSVLHFLQSPQLFQISPLQTFPLSFSVLLYQVASFCHHRRICDSTHCLPTLHSSDPRHHPDKVCPFSPLLCDAVVTSSFFPTDLNYTFR